MEDHTATQLSSGSSLALAGDFSAHLESLKGLFDALALELTQVKQQRDESRQQVTNLLYHRDGATRVVARNLDEIALLKRKIQELEDRLENQGPSQRAKIDQPEDIESLRAEIVRRIETLANNLLQVRKQRIIQARDKDAFATYSSKAFPASIPQATSLSVLFSRLSKLEDSRQLAMPGIVSVGTNTGDIIVTNFSDGERLAELKGHSAPVNSVLAFPFPSNSHVSPTALASLTASSGSSTPYRSPINILSAASDSTLRLWRETNLSCMDDLTFLEQSPSVHGSTPIISADASTPPLNFTCEHVFRLTGDLCNMALHPTGCQAAVCGKEKGFSFVDLTRGLILNALISAPTKVGNLIKKRSFLSL